MTTGASILSAVARMGPTFGEMVWLDTAVADVYMHVMGKIPELGIERIAIQSCACHKVRRAARAVTRSYDEALRPVGLRATQYAALAAVATEGAVSITALAKIMGMDRSTLTRNLRPLEKQSLIVIGREGRHRSRTVEITRQGRVRVRAALPHWESAQKALRLRLGDANWAAMHDRLDELIRVA